MEIKWIPPLVSFGWQILCHGRAIFVRPKGCSNWGLVSRLYEAVITLCFMARKIPWEIISEILSALLWTYCFSISITRVDTVSADDTMTYSNEHSSTEFDTD